MEIAENVYIAKGVLMRGNVKIGEQSSVWFNSVVRSSHDMPITIGRRSNIQDGSVIKTSEHGGVRIGDDVTVGHMVLLHGCTVGDRSLIGMGSTIMNDAKIGSDCIIGAGSLVTQGTVIPDGMMAFGRPAKVIRPLTGPEKESLVASAETYVTESLVMTDENCRDQVLAENGESK